MHTSNQVDIPDVLRTTYTRDPQGLAWIAALPQLIEDSLDRWALTLDGRGMHGMASLVVPVRTVDGMPAAVKLQPVNDENIGESVGLQTWKGDGAVLLLDHDPDTCTLLLERLDATRPLSKVRDATTAVDILAGLLARLVAVPAPEGLRRLADITAAMVDAVPAAVGKLSAPGDRRLMRACASTVSELVGDVGNQLLHWDLHYDNILAGEREPWLAIDPKPLAGDPAFELLPALGNRWDDVVASGNVRCAVLRRFDQLTEAVGVDRQRAVGWTLGRVLQNALWDIEDGETRLDPVQVTIAAVLRHRKAE